MQATSAIIAIAASSFLLGTPVRPVSHTDPNDACSLLTQAQVSAALGLTMDMGRRVVYNNPKMCAWAPPGGATANGPKVTLTLVTSDAFDRSKTPANGATMTPVKGVGDEAFYITGAGTTTALSVRKGTSTFQVRVGGFQGEKAMQIAKTLAMNVLSNL
ncbi:MAG TPA: hypothetical protein VEI06_16955 [Gemmatimonadaceae bacterium]|nr:hypothetical protein [Gemmatimonadaceae bacterium]